MIKTHNALFYHLMILYIIIILNYYFNNKKMKYFKYISLFISYNILFNNDILLSAKMY
jgi:hypothetical protein